MREAERDIFPFFFSSTIFLVSRVGDKDSTLKSSLPHCVTNSIWQKWFTGHF